jgi:hypothetical protein
MVHIDEDWGDCFDDLDAGFWADFFGGPDDSEIERTYEFAAIADSDLDYDQFECDEDDDAEDPIDHASSNSRAGQSARSRLAEIVKRLARSAYAREFRRGGGFFVPRGPVVRLTDGRRVDLFEWLRSVGIDGGKIIAGYRVVYTPPGGRYPEKLSFFSTSRSWW